MEAVQEIGEVAVIHATRRRCVKKVRGLWERSRESFAKIGQELLEAKEALPHGEFTAMIREDMPFSPWTARLFMRIASDPRLVECGHVNTLPEDTRALDELRKLDDRTFEEAIQSGEINKDMTREDAKALTSPRPQVHVKPRTNGELTDPIVCQGDLLATLAGTRLHEGVSQEEIDHRAGFDSGYTGKLEVGTRQHIAASFWTHIGALKLAMVLVPHRFAMFKNRCPACGREK